MPMANVLVQARLPSRYSLLDHIAEGGTASVWSAYDTHLDRKVAIKILGSHWAEDERARRRFQERARVAASISDHPLVSHHPHVATVFALGETLEAQARPFIVMEYFPRGTVDDRLRAFRRRTLLGEASTGQDQPVPRPTALRWLREAASALDAVHLAGFVHGDLTPGDLLLHDHGRLAVGDFGIRLATGKGGQIDESLRTEAYLSPEQALGATAAGDRYSLAVIAYELLCGRRPFEGPAPVLEVGAHAASLPFTASGPCAPAAPVFAAGLAREPARRPESATALVAAIEDAFEEASVEDDTAEMAAPERRVPRPSGHLGAPPPRLTAANRSGRFPRWVAPLVALLLVAGAIAFMVADVGNDGSNGSAPNTTTQPRSSSESRGPVRPTPTTSPTPGAASPDSTTTNSTGPTQTSAATPSPASDGRSPAQLNNAGFALLPQRPQEALPLLRRAVADFRASGDRRGIDYAYALYNLGWALRLAGRPAEAVPYLEERLRISDYKRAIVEAELRTALQAAGR